MHFDTLIQIAAGLKTPVKLENNPHQNNFIQFKLIANKASKTQNPRKMKINLLSGIHTYTYEIRILFDLGSSDFFKIKIQFGLDSKKV